MARAAINVQTITLAGATPTFQAGDSANGHYFNNNGKTFLEVKDTGAGACTVTILAPNKVGGVTIPSQTYTVPQTSGDKVIGPFDPSIFNQAGGFVAVDISTGTGVTIAAFTM